MSSVPTKIGIAVVELTGAYLVGFRGQAGPLPGLSEFPGGKCLAGESSSECAVRECFEETGLRISPVRLLLNRVFTYEHGTVDLDFWLCRPEEPSNVDAEHNGFRWMPVDRLAELDFPEANRRLIQILTEGC